MQKNNQTLEGKSTKRLLLTGGHAATTARATIEELKNRLPDIKLFFIGSTSALEGTKSATLESQLLPKLGVDYKTVLIGRLQPRFTRHTLPALLKTPIGFIQSLVLILQIRPNLILSFGGASSLPVCFWGYIFRIPIVIHEQTSAVGLSNKITSHFATKIAISRETSKQFFPNKKIVLTGNPVGKHILNLKPKTHLGNPVTIFVTGGSRGSQVINSTLDKILPQLTINFKIIHQTGKLDFSSFKEKENASYKVFDTIEPDIMADFFQKADIVIARAGANTVSELILLQTPSILIPIPWTRYDEQTKNANFAATVAPITILNQDQLTPKLLLTTINHLKDNWSKLKKNKSIFDLDRNATHNLVNLLTTYLE